MQRFRAVFRQKKGRPVVPFGTAAFLPPYVLAVHVGGAALGYAVSRTAHIFTILQFATLECGGWSQRSLKPAFEKADILQRPHLGL